MDAGDVGAGAGIIRYIINACNYETIQQQRKKTVFEVERQGRRDVSPDLEVALRSLREVERGKKESNERTSKEISDPYA